MLVHKEQLENFDFTGMICIELLKKKKKKNHFHFQKKKQKNSNCHLVRFNALSQYMYFVPSPMMIKK
jgi:hypothetical protein